MAEKIGKRIHATPNTTAQAPPVPVLSIHALNVLWYYFGPKSQLGVSVENLPAVAELRQFAAAQAALHPRPDTGDAA